MKWDGVRAVVYVEGGTAAARCRRNDIDMTAAYPELREMASRSARGQVVLDGEIVALDARRAAQLRARCSRACTSASATQIRRWPSRRR